MTNKNNQGFYYWADESILPNLNLEKIKVKYDPLDMDVAFALINDNWKKLVRNGA